jgi:hypothetical protein
MNKPQERNTLDARQVQQLKKLIALGEGQTLEFKRKAAHPEKIVREMIAFANAQGGIVLIGVGDDGSIPGLKHPEDDSHVIRQALKHCRPSLPVTEMFVPVTYNRTVIQYVISESSRKPHYWLNANRSKECFVRVDDKSVKASRELREISRRLSRKKGIYFRYGDHEHLLMQYLDQNKTITLKKFSEIAKLRKVLASKKLILLVLANVLRITPTEKGDLYSLAMRPE